MVDRIDDALKRVYVSAPSDNTFIETLEISHPLFADTHYLANDPRQWDFYDEKNILQNFQASSFSVKPPDVDSSGNQNMSIGIASTDGVIVSELERAQNQTETPIKVIMRVYLDIPNSFPMTNPPIEMFINQVDVSNGAVTAVASRFYVLGRVFPRNLYTLDEFPGLRR